MYTTINFKTKKAFKEAVANGGEVMLFQPGPFGGVELQRDGTCAVEGPPYPQPHTWYAKATLENGIVVKVS